MVSFGVRHSSWSTLVEDPLSASCNSGPDSVQGLSRSQKALVLEHCQDWPENVKDSQAQKSIHSRSSEVRVGQILYPEIDSISVRSWIRSRQNQPPLFG